MYNREFLSLTLSARAGSVKCYEARNIMHLTKSRRKLEFLKESEMSINTTAFEIETRCIIANWLMFYEFTFSFPHRRGEAIDTRETAISMMIFNCSVGEKKNLSLLNAMRKLFYVGGRKLTRKLF